MAPAMQWREAEETVTVAFINTVVPEGVVQNTALEQTYITTEKTERCQVWQQLKEKPRNWTEACEWPPTG